MQILKFLSFTAQMITAGLAAGKSDELIKQDLEHRYLNDVPGLDNPTSENLALWMWQRIDPMISGLARIVVMEGHDRGCTYRGPDGA